MGVLGPAEGKGDEDGRRRDRKADMTGFSGGFSDISPDDGEGDD